MNSEQILQKLQELIAQKESLEKEIDRLKTELASTLSLEYEAAQNDLANTRREAIYQLCDLFWADDDNAEYKKMIANVKDERLPLYLEEEIKSVLKKTELKQVDQSHDIVKDCQIDWFKCLRDAQIRLDFGKALKEVKYGSDLSSALGYGFSPDDLLALLKLHKKNTCRKKIEDLLEDCNFHTECGLLYEKRYDECEALIREDMSKEVDL